jgi:predicted nuclease with RNAse H fold
MKLRIGLARAILRVEISAMSELHIGIDVGAPAKGYHAVALRGSMIEGKLHSREPLDVARWCVDRGAETIAIDAPCRWRVHGDRVRAAERELAADRIACFSTPTEAKARGNAFYTWMFAGQELYMALAESHPIFNGDARRRGVAIETFPQAVACGLAGQLVSAKTKLAVRREVLFRAGIDITELVNIDEVDATLCALAARYFAANDFKAYGDALGGFIVVPASPLAAGQAVAPPPVARRVLATVLERLPQLTAEERRRVRAQLDQLERTAP